MREMKKKVVLNVITAIVAVLASPVFGVGIAAMAGYDQPSWFSRIVLGMAFVAIFCLPMQFWYDLASRKGRMTDLYEFGFRFVLVFVLHFVLTFANHRPHDYRWTALVSLGIAVPLAVLGLIRGSGRSVPPPEQLS